MTVMSDSDVQDFVSQPLDGLLYDLGLLPEQVCFGTPEYLYSQVIIALYNRGNK